MKKREELETKLVKLADMVDYQTDSVVSRTILDKKAGTVTLFAFDQGQGLSEHRAPYDAMVFLIEGKAEVAITGKPSILSQGEMTIMPANKPHAIQAVTRFKMLLIMIHA